ncbi:MAG: LL-diaminopimelate aminotransferase [Thermosediminibacterales bacterium]|jgi:LL-diaminopimelate aminotransferase|nr:LL-diaminopimelate aminotransferase [Thermosediminibacterales bacterium]
MEKATRIKKIPPYLFAEIDKKKEAAIKRGVDVISLGIGDPDLPTPGYIIESLYRSVQNPANHQYPSYIGSLNFRKAVADWYRRRYNIELDPETEVMALIGSKEGIAHMFWAYIDPEDYALIPDPAYPVYKTGTIFAGGVPYIMPLRAENNFLPDLSAIGIEIAKKAKLMFLNYPNNPTASVASLEFFQRVVDFAREHNILVCHDSAYIDITFDGYKAPSILQAQGAKDVCVEFGSLSKPFNMTGWRIGYAVGNKEALANLAVIKTNIDSGQFNSIQDAAIDALEGPEDQINRMIEVYKKRRDLVVDTLKNIGIDIEKPKGTFYIWAPVPHGYTSAQFAEMLLEQTGVIVSPGNAYGNYGEGYFRISLTISEARLIEALERMKKYLKFK